MIRQSYISMKPPITDVRTSVIPNCSLVCARPNEIATHSLDKVTTEADLEKLMNIWQQWCSSRGHRPDLSTKKRSDLASNEHLALAHLSEDESIVDGVFDFTGCPPIGNLGVDSSRQQGTFQSWSVHLSLDGSMQTDSQITYMNEKSQTYRL